jgi:hypothetical protein
MKILATIRNVLVVFIGVLFYGEIITFSEAFGYSISLAGFIAYNLAKMGYFDSKQPINKPAEKDIEQLLSSVSND